MPLPSLDKTWAHDLNNSVSGQASAEDRHAQLFIDIKDALIATGTAVSVVGSSDSVAASMDGTDRLSVIADIVAANDGVAHSWIVLRFANINTGNYEMCFDFSSISGRRLLTFVWSPLAGFTGGSITDRPTATDEMVIQSDLPWAGNFAGGDPVNPHIWNVQGSTDGQATRVIGYYANDAIMLWMFDRPKDPVSGWGEPSICCITTNVTSASLQLEHNFFYNANTRSFAYDSTSGTHFNFYWALIAFNNIAITDSAAGGQMAPNDFSAEWPLNQPVIYSGVAPTRGPHGQIFDWFMGSDLNVGNEYPSGGARTFAQHGHMVGPWDGSVVIRA